MITEYDSNVVRTLNSLDDVVENLLLLLSDKEKTVIKKRFCIDSDKKYTLEEIGKEFSVTRERIRQIEKNALNKMRRNVFNTSLKDLHQYMNKVMEDNGGIILEDKVVEDLKLLNSGKIDENSLHFSMVLNSDVECVGNTIQFHPYIKNKKLSSYALKHASNFVINELNKNGDVIEIDNIYENINEDLKKNGFDKSRVKSLIDIDKRLTIVSDDLVGLLEWRHIRPRTLRDKIFYVLRQKKESMHFTDIAELIDQYSFDNRPINVQAVHNELIRHDGFVLIGRGIYALKSWGYESGTVLDVIERVLSSSEEMHQDEIVEKVLEKRKVKKITIMLALKNGENIERVGRKVYKLKSS